MDKPSKSPPWYESAFSSFYLTLYSHRNREDALRAVEFVRGRIDFESVDRALDLCCGAGRHMIELRDQGLPVVGLDLSRDLLEVAARDLGGETKVVQGSMSRLPFCGSFDLVLSLFTSFGYFEKDEENAEVFAQVASALRPGGKFIFDFLNAPAVRSSLVPSSSERIGNSIRVETRRSIEGDPPRVVKRLKAFDQGRVREIVESVRLFERQELESMLVAAGFDIVGVWGDFDCSAHGDSSPRCIIISRRPE